MLLSVRDNSDVLDPGLVQEAVSDVMTGQYWQFATTTLLVYDTVITMDREIEFFWRRRLTKPVNLIYFINRYIGIFGAISRIFEGGLNVNQGICKFSDWALNISNWVTIVSIDYILMIRVLALYSRRKSLTICLMTLLGLETVSKFAIVVYGTWANQVSSVPLTEKISICTNNGGILTLAIIDWTIPGLYGLILTLLALHKAAEYWRIEAGLKGFKLVRVLTRDQMVYFILVVSCCIFNIMEFKLDSSNGFLTALLEQLGNPSFLCILGSRLLFNMKEAGKLGVNEGTSYRMKSMSSIKFEQPVESKAITNNVEGSEIASRA